MHRTIAELSRTGNNVIAEHVLVEPAWLDECVALFSDLPAYFVGVRCPLEVLEERERSRKNRTLGQARAQYGLVHARAVYDLEVDTSLHSAAACAQQIKAMIETTPPRALRQLAVAQSAGLQP